MHALTAAQSARASSPVADARVRHDAAELAVQVVGPTEDAVDTLVVLSAEEDYCRHALARWIAWGESPAAPTRDASRHAAPIHAKCHGARVAAHQRIAAAMELR